MTTPPNPSAANGLLIFSGLLTVVGAITAFVATFAYGNELKAYSPDLDVLSGASAWIAVGGGAAGIGTLGLLLGWAVHALLSGLSQPTGRPQDVAVVNFPTPPTS